LESTKDVFWKEVGNFLIFFRLRKYAGYDFKLNLILFFCRTASLDVEPLYTFRSHSGPVTCLVMGNSGEQVFSSSLDGTIKMWNLPNSNIDPYDSFDPGVLVRTLVDHKDAVWGLSLQSQRPHLLSFSADKTVKLWDTSSKNPLLESYTSEKGINKRV